MWVVRGLVAGGAVAALVVAGCPAPGGSTERPPSDTAFGSACADPVAGVAVQPRDLVVRPAGAPGYVAEWCDR